MEDIKLRISRQRNSLMAALASKTMIYRGLCSGIIRVMRENVRIDFINEESANLFKTIIWRTAQKDEKNCPKEQKYYPKGIDNYPKDCVRFLQEQSESK